MNFLFVFFGGGLGSISRFGISLLIAKTFLHTGISTLVSNILACVIMAGVIFSFQEKNLVPDNYKNFILIGICGGLSTFSTFSFETVELLKQGMFVWAIVNILVSCVMCMSIFYIFSK